MNGGNALFGGQSALVWVDQARSSERANEAEHTQDANAREGAREVESRAAGDPALFTPVMLTSIFSVLLKRVFSKASSLTERRAEVKVEVDIEACPPSCGGGGYSPRQRTEREACWRGGRAARAAHACEERPAGQALKHEGAFACACARAYVYGRGLHHSSPAPQPKSPLACSGKRR